MGQQSFSLNVPGHRGVVIEKNACHPENYLWILVDGRRFFLGVLTPGVTRSDVKRMALAHPQLQR